MVDISVIIPCYNVERTITATLDSLDNQLFRDFETVIVDDGSTDSTEGVIKNYSSKSKNKIRFFKQKNQGVSSARNLGITNSVGKYIAFLDADDLYHPSFLSVLHKRLDCQVYDIATCNYQNTLVNIVDYENSFSIISKDDLLKMYFNKRVEKLNFGGALYKKKIILKNNLRFDTNISYGEDSKFFCEYLWLCENNCVHIKLPLYIYIDQSNSAMKQNTYKKTDNIYVFEGILQLWGINDNDDRYGIYFRSIWSCAKDFAIDKNKFKKLESEYPINYAMKQLTKLNFEKSIKISAILYTINPNLFCIFIRLFNKLKAICTYW